MKYDYIKWKHRVSVELADSRRLEIDNTAKIFLQMNYEWDNDCANIAIYSISYY